MLTLLLTPEKTAVASLYTEGQIALPTVSLEEWPLAVGMLSRIENPTGQELWTPNDLTDWTFAAAIGLPGLPSSGGTYTVTTTDDTTDPVPISGGVAALNAAFVAKAMAINAVEISEGYYRLEWINDGAQALATAEAGGLYPPSDAEIKMLVEGGLDTPGIQTLRLVQSAAAATQLMDYEDEVTGTVEVVQVGSGSGNHQVRVSFDPVPIGGTFRIVVTGQSRQFSYDADAETVQAGVEQINYGVDPIGEGNVRVTKEATGRYFIEFINEHAKEDMGTITATDEDLKRIPVWTGAIDLAQSVAIEELLGNADSVVLLLEITGTPDGGSARKLYREPITLVSPVVRPTV